MKKKVFNIILSLILVTDFLLPQNTNVTFAEETALATGSAIANDNLQKSEAELRLIYTTDIHGQVKDYDYQTGKTVPKGLNKAYTLIKKARQEVKDNYLTFDVGDSFMNYTTDYIEANSSSHTIQPVYKAMEKIGYDAITLGNHEFDYGYDYLIEQLEDSGLMGKCVLSNVRSNINGNYVFGQENKILKKKITDSNGNERTINVGIFGVTPPSMSSRTEGLRSAVVSEDILVAAKREASLLKNKGADIVIALAHSGFGTETPAGRVSSTAYAMSKISDIDIILAGHQHVNYPDPANKKFYNYPGVEKQSGLVNGKRLMILRDSCFGIGVVDLEFQIDENGKISLKSSDCEIRKVTKSTQPDKEITECMSEWDKKLKEDSSIYVGKIKNNSRWQNYTGVLEDNEIAQVVHNAQMQYALNKIKNGEACYRNYPVISMMRFVKYGAAGSDNYSDVSGNVYNGTMDNFAMYNCHVYIYEVTGRQLREWVEWGASVYQTINTSKMCGWDDIVVSDFVNTGKGNSLLQNEYQNDWSKFFSFNGIEYTIDPTQKPRYDSSGNKINNTFRVTSLTCNGIEVTDDQKFALCTEQILTTLNTEATKGIKEQVISKSYDLLQDLVKDYLKDKALIGEIRVNSDNNWSLKLPDKYPFIIVSGENSNNVISKCDWYIDCISTLGGYRYYKGIYKAKDIQKDKDGPNVVVSVRNKKETNKSVNIDVTANDISGVGKMMYMKGVVNNTDPAWHNGGSDTKSIINNEFKIKENGVYSVYVEDRNGNATVENFSVTNIYPAVLLKPMVNKVTNKSSFVTGKAEPNTTVYVDCLSKKYYATVAADGSYKVKIPFQKAGNNIIVFVIDNKNRASKATTVKVQSVGPNCPMVNKVKNTETKITGKYNDKIVGLYAVIGKNVYISKNINDLYYKNSKGYNKNLSIKKVNISIKSNGSYTIRIPNQHFGTIIYVYSVDKVGRVSGARKVKVTKAAPNRAIVYDSTDAEKYVFGRVPESGVCTISVKKGNGKTYYGKSDSYGYFSVNVGILEKNMKLTVKAKKGSGSYSYPAYKKVVSFGSLYKKYKNNKVTVSSVTDKTVRLEGKSPLRYSKVYVYLAGNYYSAKTDNKGYYSIHLKRRGKINDHVYVVSRFGRGGLYSMSYRRVVLGPPLKPRIISKVKKNTKTIVVQTKESCKVTLRVDKEKYRERKKHYSKNKKLYYYVFSVKKLQQNQRIIIYASNNAGTTMVTKRV